MNFSLPGHFLSIWPAILTQDLVRYALAAGVLAAILAACRRHLERRRLQARHATARDIRREIGYSLLTVVIFSATGYSIALGVHFDLLRVTTGPLPGFGQLLADFVLIVLAHDAYFYWLHRLIHRRRWFRSVHRVHHLSRTPTPWAAYAFAPAEALLQAVFLPLFWFLFETHVLVGFLFTSHMIVRNVIGHAGVELFPAGWLDWPLLRWITTTTHHDMHHQYARGNYGLYFRFWDRLMGTELADYEARFRAAVRRPAPPQRRSVLGLLLVGLVLLAALNPALADPGHGRSMTGRWVTPGFGAVVKIAVVGSPATLEATVVWVFDPADSGFIDVSLFDGFVRDGTAWHGGMVYDPASGRRYRANVSLDGRNRLVLKGCVGPFCREQTWHRYEAVIARLPPD